jgi:hypothetical protein
VIAVLVPLQTSLRITDVRLHSAKATRSVVGPTSL